MSARNVRTGGEPGKSPKHDFDECWKENSRCTSSRSLPAKGFAQTQECADVKPVGAVNAPTTAGYEPPSLMLA